MNRSPDGKMTRLRGSPGIRPRIAAAQGILLQTLYA